MSKKHSLAPIFHNRPEYAPESSSGEETDEEFPFDRRKQTASPEPVDDKTELDADDPRIRRLQQREIDVNVEERLIPMPVFKYL